MIIKALEDENFTNYKYPTMFIGMPSCTFKCCTEQGLPLSTCQNCELFRSENKEISISSLIKRYLANPITHGVVFGGLEPLDSWEEVKEFLVEFRKRSSDPIVIYTGYMESELTLDQVKMFLELGIIVKFGRYVPGQKPHYDPVLGINLISDNQYARDYREV